MSETDDESMIDAPSEPPKPPAPPPPPPAAVVPPPPPPAAVVPPPPPPAAVARIRWGLGDFWWVLLAQIVGLILAGVIWAVPGIDELSEDEAGAYLFFPVQYAAMLAALAWVARKGRGSLRDDFGLRVKLRDWTAVLIGMGLVILIGNLVRPFDTLIPTDEPPQEILQTIEESESTGILVGLGLGTIVVAPFVEEIVFRGLLLRALLRRVRPWAAVSLNGIVFGVSHLAGASGWAAVPTVLALTGFGMFLAAQALRHGSLSRPILTHVGFNLVGFLATLWL